MSVSTYIQSASRTDGSFAPVNIMEIGRSSTPTDLVIYGGRIIAYNESGQVTIQDGIVQARGIAANSITAEKLTISNKGFLHNLSVVAVSNKRVDWNAGKIFLTGGDSIDVSAGTTGNLTSVNYLYSDGTQFLRATPSMQVAMAGNFVPMFVITPRDDDGLATIQDFKGNKTTISGDQIVTGKISADRLWIGMSSFVTTVGFLPEGADRANWTAGEINTANGQTLEINAGTTGRMNLRATALDVTSSTIATWGFNESAGTIADNAEGTSALDGTATGTTIIESGRFGRCRYFDGIGDEVEVSDHPSLDLVTFTIEASFSTTADIDGNEHVIMGRENLTSSSWPYRLLINEGGYVQFDIKPSLNLTYLLVSQIPLNDGNWHDIRGTFDSVSNVMELWIDNVRHSRKTNCFTDPQASAEGLFFGRSNSGGGSKYFKGYIDECRLSSVVLTSAVAPKRYIYWNNSPNLKATFTQAETAGVEKLLLATVTPKADYGSAEIQVFGNDGTIIDGNKIQTGRISSADGRTYFDLNERRIIMNDGVTDRLVLGYAPGLF